MVRLMANARKHRIPAPIQRGVDVSKASSATVDIASSIIPIMTIVLIDSSFWRYTKSPTPTPIPVTMPCGSKARPVSMAE